MPERGATQFKWNNTKVINGAALLGVRGLDLFVDINIILRRQAGRQQHSERHDLLLPHFLPGWYGIISSRPARTLSSFDVTNAMRVVTQIVCNSLV